MKLISVPSFNTNKNKSLTGLCSLTAALCKFYPREDISKFTRDEVIRLFSTIFLEKVDDIKNFPPTE